MIEKISTNRRTHLTWKEWLRLKPLKELDIQVCDFCSKLNILNLGWKPFGKFYCRTHEKKHTLCWELCYKVCLGILDCRLYRKVTEVQKKLVKPNRSYDYCACYLCGKELKGASKKGVIKNRNNPSFWGIKSEWKILCLACVRKKFYWKLEKEKRKTLNKYVKRGYV